MIADDLLVTYPHYEAPTNITAGAADTVIGAIMSGNPLPFRKLKPAETRYSALDRELLAVYFAIKTFTILFGRLSISCLLLIINH